MYFKNIAGHQSQKELCLQFVQKEKMPHAQIFFGPEGVGKLIFARALASYILCENKNEFDSCGSCVACIKSHKMIHPDIHFTIPTIGTNVISQNLLADWRKLMMENPFSTYKDWLTSLGGENKQGNINKEECNQMIKTLGLKTFESKQKIWIIWGGEFLGKEGNRLLKIIEEPPENTYIIIVLNEMDHILGTIRSRCQSLKLHALSVQDIVNNLNQWGEQSKSSDLSKISHLADGRMDEALKLIQNDVNPFEKLWIKYIQFAVQDDAYEISLVVDEIAKLGKESQKLFIQYGIYSMRQVFLHKNVPNYSLQFSDSSVIQFIEKLSKYLKEDAIQDIIGELNELQMGIIRNGNAKLLLFDSYLKIMQSCRQNIQMSQSNINT